MSSNEDVIWAKISILMANVSSEVERLRPTDIREELRLQIFNVFEILERYSNEEAQ